LPKKPKEGDVHTIEVENPTQGTRHVTFEATGKSGFGKWKIISNQPADGQPVKKITKADLAQIPLKDARRLKRRRYNKTHPDAQQNAKLTFEFPNKAWKKNPDRIDVVGFDATSPPVVEKKPKHGLKGQIVEFKGKKYVADDKGIYHPKK
jgi:hypothetical protein